MQHDLLSSSTKHIVILKWVIISRHGELISTDIKIFLALLTENQREERRKERRIRNKAIHFFNGKTIWNIFNNVLIIVEYKT